MDYKPVSSQSVEHKLYRIGDSAAKHFDKTDFNLDDAWREFDVSALVPAGAVAILMNVKFQLSTLGYTIAFRRKGNSYMYEIAYFQAPTTGLLWWSQGLIFLDSDRKAEYRGYSYGGITTIDCTIQAYYAP